MTLKTAPASFIHLPFADFKRTPVPALDIDKVIYKGEPLPTRQQIERRVVWNLLQFMAQNGWIVRRINDGDDNHQFKGDTQTRIKAAMELVFNLDECHIYFWDGSSKKGHVAYIILGNDGWDAIADYGFSETDNFATVMQEFDSEAFIEAKVEDFMAVDADGLVIGSAEHFAKWCSSTYLDPRAWADFVKAYREVHPL